MDFMKMQCCVALLGGCITSIAGYFIYGKSKCAKQLTFIQRLLFALGFSYFVLVVTELCRFFADYNLRGVALQHYDIVPPETLLFYRIFGKGVAGADQLPLLATDLRYFYMIIGTLIASLILFCFNFRKKKNNIVPIQGSKSKQTFYFSLKANFADFRKALKAEIPIWEYVLWWVFRIAMIVAAINKFRKDPSDFNVVTIGVNTLMTFIIPFLSILGIWKLFFERLPLRLQTCINLLVLTGSFLGHGCDFYGKIDNYDKYLHMFTGIVCVFIGYYLIQATKGSANLTPAVHAAASCGFSCVVSIAWEVFEFFTDYYIQGSINQNWHYTLEPNHFFAKIFGLGVNNPGQSVLVDTNMDIFVHFMLTIAGTLILFLCLKQRQKKAGLHAPVL